ncbi:hypothetical protein GC176_17945 [bacterium]|nr:hypothetical protein [bacterium]
MRETSSQTRFPATQTRFLPMDLFRRIPTVFAALVVLSIRPGGVFAGGADSSAREDDIRFTADWRWAGGTLGGYYPIRVSLQNAGPPRTINVVLKSTMSGMPSVSRRVNVDQNASAAFSLLVPLVGQNCFGELNVYANGRELEALHCPVNFPVLDWSENSFSTLVIAAAPVDFTEYEAAVTSLFGGSSSYGSQASDHQHVEPLRLPDSWLAYSGLDLVVTSIEVLNNLETLPRKALIDWVRAGGTLATYTEQDGTAVLMDAVDDLSDTNQSAFRSNWRPVPLSLRRPVGRLKVDEYGNESSREAPEPGNFKWPAEAGALQIRQLGLGQVAMLPPRPFDGTYQDWAWLLNGIQFRQQRMAARLGVAGRSTNDEFFHFLIPGVRSVPVIAFAVVITLFAVLIGPVNYFVLARRKRQGFLVITIPAIALLCSLAIFVYSFVAHGVAVRSRVRSVTWIDQGSQSAVSMARIAWFAGFAPSDGLNFSTATAFIPIWHSEGGFGNGSVDWTESQRLASGFLRSRTRTQALTTTVRDERGRLTISTPVTGRAGLKSLDVTSGLEWPLEALIVWDDDGNAWSTGRVEPGQAVTLTELSSEAQDRFLKLLRRSAPAIPPELTEPSNGMFDIRSIIGVATNHALSQGQMEQAIDRVAQGTKPLNKEFARRYVAIAAEAPGIEFGTKVTVVDGWHLIIGAY